MYNMYCIGTDMPSNHFVYSPRNLATVTRMTANIALLKTVDRHHCSRDLTLQMKSHRVHYQLTNLNN